MSVLHRRRLVRARLEPRRPVKAAARAAPRQPQPRGKGASKPKPRQPKPRGKRR